MLRISGVSVYKTPVGGVDDPQSKIELFPPGRGSVDVVCSATIMGGLCPKSEEWSGRLVVELIYTEYDAAGRSTPHVLNSSGIGFTAEDVCVPGVPAGTFGATMDLSVLEDDLPLSLVIEALDAALDDDPEVRADLVVTFTQSRMVRGRLTDISTVCSRFEVEVQLDKVPDHDFARKIRAGLARKSAEQEPADAWVPLGVLEWNPSLVCFIPEVQ